MDVASAPVIERACRRNTCDEPARVSLVFDYGRAQAWLLDLVAEPHPLRWDLCPLHAEALSVPRGWELVDDRTELAEPQSPPSPEPTHHPPQASASADEAASGPPGTGHAPDALTSPGDLAGDTILLTQPRRRPRRGPTVHPASRYAPLLRALPRLAAEHAARQQQAAQAAGLAEFEAGTASGEADAPADPLATDDVVTDPLATDDGVADDAAGPHRDADPPDAP